MAGLLGLRGAQAIRSGRTTTLEDVVEAIRTDGHATREVLERVRVDLAVLRDRDTRRPSL